MRYQDIDWNEMWRTARAAKSWKKKKHKDWDKRAATFAQRNIDSPFVSQFLEHVSLKAEWTVLDVGSGPGTLSIPLADKVKSVTALDYSGAMLEELNKQARQRGLNNIHTQQAAWEDDWQSMGIEKHDMAIASRSLSVDDLAGALSKLDSWTNKAVYIADRVGAGPFDPDLFAAIGRKFEPGPDYIFTLNILYSLGINAHVDYITLDHRRSYQSRDKALESYRWMVDDITPDEEKRLEEYVYAHLSQVDETCWQFSRRVPPKWALIWWHKNG